MTKAQIAGLEDSFNWFSYIVELHKEKKRGQCLLDGKIGNIRKNTWI